MARGRFISKAITTDRAVNDLSSDTCRLAFTWLITIADCEGRTVGEPDLLKAALFPRRSDITPEQIEAFISEWMEAEFIIWYYGKDGDRYIQFVNFEKHQSGLRKDREAASEIDAPDDCRTVDGLTPEEIGLRLRLRLSKGKEEEKKSSPSDSFDIVHRSIEMITGLSQGGKPAVDSINSIVEMGALFEDIEAGYAWLCEMKKDVKYYSQLIGPTRTAMAKRLQLVNGKPIKDRAYSEVHE